MSSACVASVTGSAGSTIALRAWPRRSQVTTVKPSSSGAMPAEDVGVAVARRQQEQGRAVAGHLVVDRRADDLDQPLTDVGHGVLACRLAPATVYFAGRNGAVNWAW